MRNRFVYDEGDRNEGFFESIGELFLYTLNCFIGPGFNRLSHAETYREAKRQSLEENLPSSIPQGTSQSSGRDIFEQVRNIDARTGLPKDFYTQDK